MTTGILTRGVKRSAVQVLVFLLSILYLTGTSHLELLHSFVHSHDALVSHSVEQENDPCHRLIYHNDKQQGCDHDSHLVVSEKCQTCDLAFHGDQTILSCIEFCPDQFSVEYFGVYKLNLESHRAVISSSRAPPVLA